MHCPELQYEKYIICTLSQRINLNHKSKKSTLKGVQTLSTVLSMWSSQGMSSRLLSLLCIAWLRDKFRCRCLLDVPHSTFLLLVVLGASIGLLKILVAREQSYSAGDIYGRGLAAYSLPRLTLRQPFRTTPTQAANKKALQQHQRKSTPKTLPRMIPVMAAALRPPGCISGIVPPIVMLRQDWKIASTFVGRGVMVRFLGPPMLVFGALEGKAKVLL